jgi:hypothetical protein
MPTWNFLVGLGIVDQGTGKFLKDTKKELDGTTGSFKSLGNTADDVADRTAKGAKQMADAVDKSSREMSRSWRDAGKSARQMGGGRGGGRGGRGGDKYGFLGFDIRDIGDKLKGLGKAGGGIFTGLAGDFGDMIDTNVEWSSSFKETAGISEKSVARMSTSIVTQMHRAGIGIREASGAWEDLRENLTSDEAVRDMKRAVGLKEAFDIPASTYATWVGMSETSGLTQKNMADLLDTSAGMTKKMGLPKGFLKEMMGLSETASEISLSFGLAPEKTASMTKSMMRAAAAMQKTLKIGIEDATRSIENMVKKTSDRRREMRRFSLGLGGDMDAVMDSVTNLAKGVGDADFAFSLLMDQDPTDVKKKLIDFAKTIQGDTTATNRLYETVSEAFGEDTANEVVRLGKKMEKNLGDAAKSQTANFGEMGKSIEDVMATATRAENRAKMAEQVKLFQEGSFFVGEYVRQLGKYADAQDKIARKTTGWAGAHKKAMDFIAKFVVGKQMMEFAGGRRGGGGFAGLIPSLGIAGASIAGLLGGFGGMGRGVGLFGGVAGKLGGIQPLGWLKGLFGAGKGVGAGAKGVGAAEEVAGMGAGAAEATGGFARFLGVLGKVSVVLTAIVAAADFLFRGIPRFVGIWKEGGSIWEKGWKTGVAYADTVSQVLNDLTFGLYKYIDIWGYIRRFLGDDFLLKYLPKFFSEIMGQAVSLLKTVMSIGARIVKFGWDVNVARPLKVVWGILRGVAGAIGWAVQNLWNLDKAVWGWEASVGKAFGGFAVNLFKWIGLPIENVAKDAIEWVKDIIRVPMQWIQQHLGWIKDIWDKAFGPIKDYIEAVKAFIDLRKGEMATETGVGGAGTWGKDTWGDVLGGGATMKRFGGGPNVAALQTRFGPDFLDKIMGIESAGGKAEGKASSKGARGLMQLMPSVYEPHGLTAEMLSQPEAAARKHLGKGASEQSIKAMAETYRKRGVEVGTGELVRYYDSYLKQGYSQDQAQVLATMAYNMGPGGVTKWLKGGALNSETRNYISKAFGGLDVEAHRAEYVTPGETAGGLVTGAPTVTAPAGYEGADYDMGDVTAGGMPEMPGLPGGGAPDIAYTGVPARGGGGGGGEGLAGVLGSIVDTLKRLKGDVFMDGKKIGEVVWGNIKDKVDAELREGVSTRG